MARLYFSHFPLERGKWRVWLKFLARPGFRDVAGGVRQLRHGMRMDLDPSNSIDLFCYYWNCWEPDESWILSRLLRPGDVFVDVGANLGYFTILASRLVGTTGGLIAIEPVPSTVHKLRRNLRLNAIEDRVVLHEVAVTDSPGSVRIYQPYSNNVGANTIRPCGYPEMNWDVAACTLDDLLSSQGPIRMIKLDIEGAEVKALRGFAKRLSATDGPIVLCEVTDAFLREVGDTAFELFNMMASYNYIGYIVKNYKCMKIEIGQLGDLPQANIIFTKDPVGLFG
jgi:FkbM family methyltransferase